LARQENPYRVITIEATKTPKDIKLRVAAYARVSTASDDQMNSFAAQNHYYTTLISSKENWEMVDIYADRGVTGTSAEKREDFQRLLNDCRRGLIDRVLVKSISRFARNTKECLEILRELKRLGISVCFEKENIDTATMSGEMMTAMFASIAQSESESISSNMRWSYQKRMQNGTFLPSSVPYGYVIRNGKIQISEKQAEVVRIIFKNYLAGMNMANIADLLNHAGVQKRTSNSDIIWHKASIRYILTNEHYTGNSIWQKTYMTSTFPHIMLRNHGEREMYYAQSTHPAIISMEEFDAVQALLQQRTKHEIRPSNESPFDHKIFCGQCGTSFRKKASHGKLFWSCRKHSQNLLDCTADQISDLAIKSAFLRLYYKLKHHGAEIFAAMLTNLQTIRNHRMLWSLDIVELNKQISDLSSQNQMLAELKKQGLIDPDIFIAQTNELTEQLRAAKLEKERLLAADGDNTSAQTQELMELLETGPDFLETFDGELFGELVEKIIVDSNEQLRFRLKNGLELTESMERTRR
jgi:DNA invertase Pin-like site-specific DNA recombinase